MPHKTVPLAQLRVETPCDRDWGAMAGDARTRFCDDCGRHVHDLTRMTTAEAHHLVSTATDRLCVRYTADADGVVQTLDYSPPRRPRFRAKIWLPVALVGSAAAAVIHAIVAPKVPPPTRGPIVMGDVAPTFQSANALPIGTVSAVSCPTTRPTGNDAP